jgi:hypothetical protein
MQTESKNKTLAYNYNPKWCGEVRKHKNGCKTLKTSIIVTVNLQKEDISANKVIDSDKRLKYTKKDINARQQHTIK